MCCAGSGSGPSATLRKLGQEWQVFELCGIMCDKGGCRCQDTPPCGARISKEKEPLAPATAFTSWLASNSGTCPSECFCRPKNSDFCLRLVNDQRMHCFDCGVCQGAHGLNDVLHQARTDHLALGHDCTETEISSICCQRKSLEEPQATL